MHYLVLLFIIIMLILFAHWMNKLHRINLFIESIPHLTYSELFDGLVEIGLITSQKGYLADLYTNCQYMLYTWDSAQHFIKGIEEGTREYNNCVKSLKSRVFTQRQAKRFIEQIKAIA